MKSAISTTLLAMALLACQQQTGSLGLVNEAWANKGPAASSQRPNLLLISVDTLRADHVGAYGYKKHPTSPTVDQLAADGVLFERFFSVAPWTTPAHMTMLTGLYPSTHGLNMSFFQLYKGMHKGKAFFRLPDARTTLAEVLREAGYRTAAFTSGGTLDPSFGFDQGFESYDTSMYKLNSTNMAAMSTWIGAKRDKPFFVFWHNFEVHAPYLDARFVDTVLAPAKARAVQEGTNKISSLAPGKVWPDGPGRQRKQQIALLKKNRIYNARTVEALYDGGIRAFDEWLAKLIGDLKKMGLYDNTLIVLTSDHGEEFGDRHPSRFYDIHGRTVFDEMVHVPLIFKLAGNAHRGQRSPQMASTVDLMPTVLDLLGVAHHSSEIEGISLKLAIQDPSVDEDRACVSEATSTGAEVKGLRRRHHKLTMEIDSKTVAKKGRRFIPKNPRRMFFDLDSDPREKKNLMGGTDKAAQKMAAAYEEELRAWQAAHDGQADRTQVGKETIDKLKSLGYIR